MERLYKILINVNINLNIDSETLDGYNNFEENFLRINKRDAQYKIDMYIEFEGKKDINMIKLDKKEPTYYWLISIYYFYFFFFFYFI